MKQIISVTISSDLVKWIEREVKGNAQYRNKSHLIELAIDQLKHEATKKKERN